MRIVYGAGALAAASVMTVGLVQPDFGAPAGDELEPATQNDPLAGTDAAPAGSADRRVVRYVFLRPNQEPPAGARVISTAEAAERGIAVPGRARANTTRPDGRQRQRASEPGRPARAAQPPAAEAQPRPQPQPPVRTHQSGRG